VCHTKRSSCEVAYSPDDTVRIDGRDNLRYRNAQVSLLKPILPNFDIKEWEKAVV